MKRRHVLPAMAALAAMGVLTACSREPEAPPAPPIDRSQALQVLAAEGKGFAVGALMAANTVYVLFDPQCPHCAHLWEASQPLLKQARFVWLPVSILNAKSLPQGAAILGASDPAAAMAAHETGRRGEGRDREQHPAAHAPGRRGRALHRGARSAGRCAHRGRCHGHAAAGQLHRPGRGLKQINPVACRPGSSGGCAQATGSGRMFLASVERLMRGTA
jgi:hypothetical protein